MDKLIEEALRKSVKYSLIHLNVILNGDGNKSDSYPIFKLFTILDTGSGKNREKKIDFQPTTSKLQDMVALIISEMV